MTSRNFSGAGNIRLKFYSNRYSPQFQLRVAKKKNSEC
jgi:hypothetical protein